jgi:vacuolar iron transporter family protein
MASSNYLSEKSKKNIDAEGDKNTALRTATATFMSFVSIGFIPVLPFLFTENFYLNTLGFYKPFLFSTILTLLTFIFIGLVRGKINNENKLRTSIETLGVGGVTALISYFVGYYLNNLLK